jgi:carboxypeptidase T
MHYLVDNYGVDLNRNYGYQWGYDDIGSSPDSNSDTYRGSGPFSEPETQAIRDFVTAHQFVVSLSYHLEDGINIVSSETFKE